MIVKAKQETVTAEVNNNCVRGLDFVLLNNNKVKCKTLENLLEDLVFKNQPNLPLETLR